MPTPALISFPPFSSEKLGIGGWSGTRNSSILNLVYATHQVGNAYLSDPIQILRDVQSVCYAASFSSKFSFQIEHIKDPGEGFTFYISLNRFWNMQNNFSLGLPEHDFFGLAVEFDTFQNPECSDPDYSHIGVAVGWYYVRCKSNITKPTAPSGFLLNSTSVKYAWVEYSASTSLLRVYLSEKSNKPSKPLLQYSLSLCSLLRPIEWPSLGQRNSAYFGFTASNGGYAQVVNILSWSLETSWPVNAGGIPKSVDLTSEFIKLVESLNFSHGFMAFAFQKKSWCLTQCIFPIQIMISFSHRLPPFAANYVLISNVAWLSIGRKLQRLAMCQVPSLSMPGILLT